MSSGTSLTGVAGIGPYVVIYTARSGPQFTGCQRGAIGTTAASHAIGATVRANMVAGFITALQSAVVAIETELGTVAARNSVRKDGAVTITGIKTFQDGAEFGTGNKAGTALVRLPNLGALKWRKADNSGEFCRVFSMFPMFPFPTWFPNFLYTVYSSLLLPSLYLYRNRLGTMGTDA